MYLGSVTNGHSRPMAKSHEFAFTINMCACFQRQQISGENSTNLPTNTSRSYMERYRVVSKYVSEFTKLMAFFDVFVVDRYLHRSH